MKLGETAFYILSFTWGLPLTLCGLIVALCLRISGKKPKKWGYCRYFEVGDEWGGCELGVFFLTNRAPSRHIRDHEHGHGIQNCLLGPFMIFTVCIPSAIRYWYRRLREKLDPSVKMKPYDSIWFESQASRWGSGVDEWSRHRKEDVKPKREQTLE